MPACGRDEVPACAKAALAEVKRTRALRTRARPQALKSGGPLFTRLTTTTAVDRYSRSDPESDHLSPNSSASTVPEAFVCLSLTSGRVPLDLVSVISEVDETTAMGAESDNEQI
mgnify:CR=1 FL=1